MLDKFREECGVVAIYGHPEASKLAYLGLYALQHRGQESAGISTSDGKEIHTSKSMGHVADIFTNEVLRELPGDHAIGHTRYSTTGKNTINEVQPFAVTCQHGDIAVCHNGNLPFAEARRRELEREGVIGKLLDDVFVTVGNIGSLNAMKRIGAEIAATLVQRGVQAVVLPAT